MLHRSFKPAKCKTSLKLATSRMKLMKNKRGVQMNQMKRELAQLLESGQDRTARIRVEHLIREEKMVAAYDLIEIYCELIAARLPIIESQKNCPIDLKEAITSVIFASPRCADIPELLDVKKHFTAKYGKEFITAALELRPNCGVGRMLVEKLSAVAPDGQSKVKVLHAIAEEHNIKWDSQLLEEKDSKPADDLLNGPSTFEKASEMHAEIPTIQVPNVQATSSLDKHVRPLNFNGTNSRSSLDTQNLSSTDPGGIKTTTATTHPDLRSSGRGAERMEVRRSFSKYDTFSSGRQDWNMEFKDATSAAQAAAESAERASMAARAAAELSSRGNISRLYSTESQKSTHSIRHESPEDYAAVNNSFHDRNSKLQNEQIGGDAQHNLVGADKRFHGDVHGNTERSKHSDSRRSSKGSIDDDAFVNRVQKTHGYSEKSSFKETIKAEKETISSKIDMKKKYVESGVENVSGWKDDFSSQNFDQFGEERTGKQYSMSSSRSNSSTDIDDDDSHRVDTGPKYDGGESTSYMPSPGRNSSTFPSTTADTWSPRRDALKSPKKSVSQPHFSAESYSSPLFSESLEKFVDPSESDNVPVTTYDSDGPKFDREDESEKSTYSGANDSGHFSHKHNVFSQNPKPTHGVNYGLVGSLFVKRTSGSSRRPRSESSSSDDSDSDSKEVRLKNDPVTVINAESPKKFDSGESLASHPSPRSGKSQMELNDTGNKSYLFIPTDERNVHQSSRLSSVHIDEDNGHKTGSPGKMKDDELFNQSSSESANKLNFGMLTGGFRHKGYRHPPYNRNPSGDASSLPNKVAEEGSSRTSFNSGMRNNAEKNSSFSTSITSSDSDTDNLVEEVKKTTSRRQAPYAQKSTKEVNRKSSFRPPVATYFDRDNDDSDEDIPKQAFPNRGHSGSGSSRRKKASPSSTETSSFSKVRDGSEALVSSNSSNERKPTRSHNVAESSTNLKFQTRRRPDHKDSEEHPSPIQQASSKAMPVSKISLREENFISSAVGQPSSPSSNKRVQGSLQNPKTSTLKAEPPTREDSAKRASHVHPKLPDYDSIAAHLQSLRKDRQ